MERPASDSSPGGLTRRAFISGIAATAAGFALPDIAEAGRFRRRRNQKQCYPEQNFQSPQRKVFDANEWVKSFPEKDIPGIDNVRKVTHENARRVLVVIRQLHYSWLDGENQNWPLIENCQDEAKQSIQWLQKDARWKLNSLYAEGMFKDENSHDFILRSQMPVSAKNPDKRFVARWGADRVLHQTTGLQLKGPECQELSDNACFAQAAEQVTRDRLAEEGAMLQKTLNAYRLAPLLYRRQLSIMQRTVQNLILEVRDLSDEAVKHIYEPREDYFFNEVLSHTSDDVNYVLFGGAHMWDNNVVLNNQKNPTNAFSLVVATPKTYAEWEKPPLPPQSGEIGAGTKHPAPRLVA